MALADANTDHRPGVWFVEDERTMQITARLDSIDTLVMDASPARSTGLHLSTIIKSLSHELDPKRFPARGDDDTASLPWNRFEVGFTFERVLEMAFMARREGIFRPGEVELDGIAMSPDGLDPDGDVLVLEEFKSTWMSMRDAPQSQKFVHWFWQMKAYCLAVGTLRARLRALFINGDYTDMAPQYRVWDVTFTEEELHDNWRMLLHHARQKGMLP